MATDTSDAPRLAGFEIVGSIGSGGFSDVFLYEQAMPRRQVAVKVLKASVEDVSSLTSEANLMAAIEHQYIVPVYAAPAAEDGRLCLVMKYFPGADFSRRMRERAFSVPEVLRTGIQLAGAVEAAHRVGVLHRDIKPANILSDGRRPVLTDFGIAAVVGDGDSVGFSPPWAPPEAFVDGEMDARSDVYSLAATLYTLLAQRSPFEVPGADNSFDALSARVAHEDVPPLGHEVPETLQRVLMIAMSKRPEHRPASVAELGRQLQRIESELRLASTPLDFGSTAADAPESESGEATFTGRPTPSSPAPQPASSEPSQGRRLAIIGGAVAVGVLALGGLGAILLGSDDSDAQEPAVDTPINEADDPFAQVVLAPDDPAGLVGVATPDGSVGWTWTDVDAAVAYFVRATDAEGVPLPDDAGVRVETTSVEVDADCVQVQSIGDTDLLSQGVWQCVADGGE